MKKNKFGWEIKKFDDIFNIITDGTHQTPTYTDDKVNGFKFLSSKDVVGGSINWSKVKYIPESLHNQLYSRLAPQRNDILLAKNGTTGVCAVVDNDEVFDIYVSLALLRPLPNMNVKYLAQYINSPYAKSQFNSHLKGIGVPNLHLSEIKKTKIPIPPLPIQHQIVSELDVLSEIINKKKQQLEELDKLAQATFYDMFGDPVSNEKGWEVKKIKDICTKITDGTHDTPQRLLEGIKFITGKHIRPNTIDYENSDYVTEDIHNEIYRRCNPEYGDVLYTNIGVNLGTAAINSVHYEFSMKNVALFKLKFDILNGCFLQYYLNNDDVRSDILANFASGGAQKFLSLTSIKQIKIPVPKLYLQAQFAAKIEQIEDQKSFINKSIVEVQQLFDYTMDKYFN